MAVTEAAKECVWMNRLVNQLGIKQENVLLLCDNHSVIHLAKNQVY